MASLLGKTLGKYQLTELLGRGGMAEVYKADHPQLDRHVTIKVLHSYLAEGEDFLARFKREAKAVAALRHPHIVQIHDFDVQEYASYMVMEFIDGGTLQERMAGLAKARKHMPFDQVLAILDNVAEALDYAHKKGIIHRDIKPSNILLDSSGEAFLTDFGIARMVSATQFTATGALVGTPTYMSPEQAMGEELTGASDLYSLGVILFELLTGKAPFEADTTPLAVIHKHVHEPPPKPSSLRPELAGELEEVVLKALEKSPQERYQSAREMTRALDKALSAEHDPKVDRTATTVRPSIASMETLVEEQPGSDRAQLPTEVMGEQTRAEMVSPPPSEGESRSEPAEPQAHREQTRDSQEAERGQALADLYAEAVRLVQEEKYQEALEKWKQVKGIDPRFPDRQKVQRAAKKGLAAQTKPASEKHKINVPRSLWMGLGGTGIVAVVTLAFILGNSGEVPLPDTIPTPTSALKDILPITTIIPNKTSTVSPPTATPATSGYADPTMYDDFDKTAYNGSYNNSLWDFGGDSKDFLIDQSAGNLSISIHDQAGAGLYSRSLSISEPTFFEVRMYLDPKTTNRGCHLYIELSNSQGYSNCGIFRTGDYAQQVHCFSEYSGKLIDADLGLTGILPEWHTIRFEIEPVTMTISFVIDGEAIDSINLKEAFPSNFRIIKQSQFSVGISMNNYGPAGAPVGYFDYVRMGAIADEP